MTKKQKTTIIGVAAMLVAVFVFATIAHRSRERGKTRAVTRAAIDDEPNILVRASAKSIGAADARVHIVEFMDPGCETCRAFHPFVQQLVDDFEGKVRLSVRYLPLHDGADTMVKILEAAGKQGLYWETLHLMFEAQPIWASHHHPQPDKIWPLLPRVGLDVDAIRRDMNAPEIAAILESDLEAARRLDIRKTPAFFVNERPLVSFGYEQLRQLVAEAVSASY